MGDKKYGIDPDEKIFTLEDILYAIELHREYMTAQYGGYSYEAAIDETIPVVIMARKEQDRQWGEQNHDDYKWLAILTEEIGEVSQAVLHDDFGGRAAGKVKEELIQVAAVAVQWLEIIDRSPYLWYHLFIRKHCLKRFLCLTKT